MYGGQNQNLPIKLNMTGVMPIIFASSIVSLVPTILAFCGVSEKNFWVRFFAADGVVYPVSLFVLIIAFSYFYTQITFDPYEDEVREILRTLIQKGCGMELNTNLGDDPIPGAKWLKLYRELGGEVITLGSDTHKPNAIGKGIREGQALLKACGFKQFCTFEKLQPVWHEL